jgi:hypothetical protein
MLSLGGCKKDSSNVKEERRELLMRQIGHGILLNAGDTISLVKPVEKEGDKYRIQFGSNFSFLPDELVNTIDSIIQSSIPKEDYLVEVEACETSEVVYSYEHVFKMDSFSTFPEIVACRSREQPEACYDVVIQFTTIDEENSPIWVYPLIGMVLLILVFFAFFYSRRRTSARIGIELGAYLFDPNRMTLTYTNNTIELTSKESELLQVLYENVNHTVDRETILNKVWGDEGDYVGRTLDVYVSKLRKKLEHDATIQLKNIRGIGYKLILEP